MNKKNFRSFEEAREFARSLGLKGQKEWLNYSKSGKRPDDIPTNPNVVYKNKGWKGMGDFLGTGTIATINREYLSFKEAREFARTLGLKGWKEWRDYSKSENKPDDMPSYPSQVYSKKRMRRRK